MSEAKIEQTILCKILAGRRDRFSALTLQDLSIEQKACFEKSKTEIIQYMKNVLWYLFQFKYQIKNSNVFKSDLQIL
jgi:hypothetical protein